MCEKTIRPNSVSWVAWLVGWLAVERGVGSNRFDVCGHIRSKPGYMLTSLGPYELVVQFGIVLS